MFYNLGPWLMTLVDDQTNQEVKISNDQELENPNQNPALKIKMGIMQTDCKQFLRIEIIRALN